MLNIKKHPLQVFLIASAVALVSINSAQAHVEVASKLEKPTKLVSAIASNNRSEANKKRDKYRHPQQTLEFFGFKPNMTVVEITPGGGWYTEILAPALKNTGKFIGAHYPDTGEDNYYSNSRKRLEKKLASNDIFSQVVLSDFVPRKASELAPANTADIVLTFRNLHNWGEEGVEQVFKDAYKALKMGGVLGVVEHRLPVSADPEKAGGYVSEEKTIAQAKAAGFMLVASSEINANAKDNAMHPKGVWTLPPSLALDEKDKDKYLAIGESDRMTLKFAKVAK